VGGCANTFTCVGIATPKGAILGVQVEGGANMSACTGIATPEGAILETEVGGGMAVCDCIEIMGPRSVILGVDLMVGGGMFAVEGVSGFMCFPNHSPPVYGSL
jgi:hypothetical protein